jgi:hypothetical protein
MALACAFKGINSDSFIEYRTRARFQGDMLGGEECRYDLDQR